MSSVTRFLRQIDTADQFVGAGTLLTLATLAYEFVPTTANYVGNYPPGAMVLASNDLTTGLGGQIANAATAPLSTSTVPIIRDMGKTVYAAVAANTTAALAGTVGTGSGWFRQYQLLLLNPISNNNFIGGTSGNTFGVAGSSASGYAPYLTFYLPSAVAGIFPTTSTASVLNQAPGGQL